MGIGKVAVHQIHQVLAAGLQGTGDDFKILLFSAYGSFYCDEWRSTLCEREKIMPFRFINKIQLSYTKQSTAGKKMAEREGFEPSVPCGTPHFQCGAFDHSTISPFTETGFLPAQRYSI